MVMLGGVNSRVTGGIASIAMAGAVGIALGVVSGDAAYWAGMTGDLPWWSLALNVVVVVVVVVVALFAALVEMVGWHVGKGRLAVVEGPTVVEVEVIVVEVVDDCCCKSVDRNGHIGKT